MANDILRLPHYPSTQSRKSLAPSQLATLNQTIATTLGTVLSLPPEKRDTPSTRSFLSTYSQDAAFQVLQNLIWKNDSASSEISSSPSNQPKSSAERLIQKRTLHLAEKVASSPPGLDIQTLLDLSIVYARSQPSQLHLVFHAAFQSDCSLVQIISNDLVPGFTALLSQQTPTSQGLYAQRKVAECIFAFLRGAKGTPELIRPFTHSKTFLVALASSYDVGLAATASSYGGISALTVGISAQAREADEWEKIWVETKVALLDSFHVILTTLLDDLASCPPGPRLAVEAERTFDIVFALLEAPSSSTTPSDIPATPFLNQTLLADYEQSYSLSKALAVALKHAQEKDARLDLLESTLQSLDVSSQVEYGGKKQKNPGALKILLRSSGIQPGIDNLGNRGPRPEPTTTGSNSKGKGKSRAEGPILSSILSDPDLDIKATQVLDIFPDTPVDYIKLLLTHDRYGQNPEKVIEAMLEGTAIGQEELERDFGGEVQGSGAGQVVPPKPAYSIEQRRNAFDDEQLDLSRLRIGKKSADDEVLRDRSFIEQMKADILRRAEMLSDEEDEAEGEATAAKGKGKDKETFGGSDAVDLGPDDDEELVAVRLGGDGEDTEEEEDDEDEGDEPEEVQTPETIVELAYLRDPKIFNRDAATRRSKARGELKTQTGWGDEQIEGWKIMLERTPGRKEKLEEKHAFRGNEKGLVIHAGGGNASRGRRGGGPRGGRGRGRGAGGGGGGGRGGGSSGGGESSARERAWKDKNKASRGNHNRKRGHDKKMVRAGAVAGPSS